MIFFVQDMDRFLQGYHHASREECDKASSWQRTIQPLHTLLERDPPESGYAAFAGSVRRPRLIRAISRTLKQIFDPNVRKACRILRPEDEGKHLLSTRPRPKVPGLRELEA